MIFLTCFVASYAVRLICFPLCQRWGGGAACLLSKCLGLPTFMVWWGVGQQGHCGYWFCGVEGT